MIATIQRLSTGYYLVRGVGPCNWSQPKTWPCSEEHFTAHAFPEASDEFIRDAMRIAARRPTGDTP